MFASATLVLALLPGRAGAAGDYQQVLKVYEREGSVPACQFTAAQLQTALGGVDTYGAQYFADFTQAVQAALIARAGGACVAMTGAGGYGGGPQPSPPPPPTGQLTAASSGSLPLPLALLGGLALVGVLTLVASAGAGRRRRRS
jgi:hypothetical protein